MRKHDMKWIQRHLNRVLATLRFFTRIPIPGGGAMPDEEFGKSLAYAPLAGLLVGVWTAGWDYGLRLVLPAGPAAVLTLLAYVGMTGGLHLDGLGDTFDGILSGRSRDRMLAIMKDSRVGSFGVLAVWFALAMNTVSIAALPGTARFAALCLWPVLGRLASVTGASLYEYVRPEGGLGKTFVEFCGKRELVIGACITLLAAGLLLGWRGLVWTAADFAVTLLLLAWMTKPLGGITGDVMGAACEGTQVFALPLWLILCSFT
jgi:adenosylcobinamide-GDP ribazoletransferase